MAESRRTGELVRFEGFDLDVRTGELRKNGATVFRFSEQPLRILLALLERPGELVLREELRKQLWPGDTVVEFEHGIGSAISRLRQVLGDSARNPRFIETLSRRGFRWKTPVEWDPADTDSLAAPSAIPIEQEHSSSRILLLVAGLILLVLVASAAGIFLRGGARAELKLTQLTQNSSELPVRTGAISPDGKHLAYTDANGIHVKVLSTKEVRTLPQPASLGGKRVYWWVIAWFPDGDRFLAQIAPFGEGCLGCEPGMGWSIWVASALGGEPRKIHDDGAAESISPDGKWIAYTAKLGNPGGKEIWMMDAEGQHSRKLFETNQDSWMRYARWSADGKRLAYVLLHDTLGQHATLESRDLEGGPPVVILANADAVEHDYVWLPSGPIIYGMDEPQGNGCNYWKLGVDVRSGEAVGKPRKITNWGGFCLDSTSATADGRRLVFTEAIEQRTIYLGELQSSGILAGPPRRLTLNEGTNRPIAWTSDSKAVMFVSNAGGASGLFKQALDSDTAESMHAAVGDGHSWTVSPDGKWILYVAGPEGEGRAGQEVLRVPASGGIPQVVFSGSVSSVSCAKTPSALCLLSEWDGKQEQVILSELNPIEGKRAEVMRIKFPHEHINTTLSPDGAQVALFGGKEPIRVVSLSDKSVRELNLKDWNGLDHVNWTRDSKALYVACASKGSAVLLYADLQGNNHVIFEQRGSLSTSAIPSLDGRHLAMEGQSLSSNVWMMENF